MPQTSMLPSVGLEMPSSRRNMVVLPAPLAPTRPTSPRGRSIVRSSRAVTPGYCLVRPSRRRRELATTRLRVWHVEAAGRSGVRSDHQREPRIGVLGASRRDTDERHVVGEIRRAVRARCGGPRARRGSPSSPPRRRCWQSRVHRQCIGQIESVHDRLDCSRRDPLVEAHQREVSGSDRLGGLLPCPVDGCPEGFTELVGERLGAVLAARPFA